MAKNGGRVNDYPAEAEARRADHAHRAAPSAASGANLTGWAGSYVCDVCRTAGAGVYRIPELGKRVCGGCKKVRKADRVGDDGGDSEAEDAKQVSLRPSVRPAHGSGFAALFICSYYAFTGHLRIAAITTKNLNAKQSRYSRAHFQMPAKLLFSIDFIVLSESCPF